MSEEVLVNNCSPTLAGIKTANLFSHSFHSKSELNRDLRRFNSSLAPRGLCLCPLKIRNNWALLYLFRRDKLQKDLNESEALQILKEAGYATDDYRSCLTSLVEKLNREKDFPHEMGLFLSYPPEDVKGFIRNHAKNFKFVGYWKVYGDEEKAKKKFSEYDRCTQDYKKRYMQGAGLESLIV